MNIVIITDQPVPNGMAATNRLLSLATGIYENGCNINILILNPTEKADNIKNTTLEGYYKEVKYNYLTKTTVLPKGSFSKFIIFFNGLIKALFELKRIKRNSTIDAIIIGHTWSIYPLAIYYLFTKPNKIIFTQTISEYLFIGKNKNIYRRLDYFIYTHFVLRCFDGLIVMTRNLQNYYSNFLNKHAIVKVIPMTVEPERFENHKIHTSQNYIAYCGYLGGNKDGVYDLIKAFAIISNKFPNHFLYIIGDSKYTEELLFLKKLAKEKGIEDRVIFTGKVSRDEIPALLNNAEVLALSRPKSIQSEGGFPTKLGEYLATGNPVVVTRVGEIPDYFTDGLNAYLANPDDIKDFADKLALAITNKEQSKTIGIKGKELAYTVFNNHVQGKRIIEFINKIHEFRS